MYKERIQMAFLGNFKHIFSFSIETKTWVERLFKWNARIHTHNQWDRYYALHHTKRYVKSNHGRTDNLNANCFANRTMTSVLWLVAGSNNQRAPGLSRELSYTGNRHAKFVTGVLGNYPSVWVTNCRHQHLELFFSSPYIYQKRQVLHHESR